MIELRSVTLSTGPLAGQPMSLSLEPGEHVLLLGPTGSGKTTLLETLAGLRPHGGELLRDGKPFQMLPPGERQVAYVPQDATVFGHLSVARNLEFALDVCRLPRKTRRSKVSDIADQLGLRPLLARRATVLSGGEAQRVAIGRALLRSSADLLLLDEPTSALDGEMKHRVLDLLWNHGQTRHVLHATHDPTLADRERTRTVSLMSLASP